MEIHGYLKTSAIEWSGKISSVLFVPGCNFRCPFCYNRDLVLNPDKLPKISEKEVFADLKKRKKWIDAVVVTGGEPTLQSDLDKFLKKVKKLGFLTMIETNGSKPEVIHKLIAKKLVDYIAMDIKACLNKNYGKTVGKKDLDFTLLLRSIREILNSGIDFEFRTTVVPGIHDKKALVLMAKQLKKILRYKDTKILGIKWFLQEFQPKTCLDPKFEKIKPFSKMEMEKFLKAVKKIISGAELR